MDGWMAGWVDGWMDGWMDVWMDGWMDGWEDGCMYGWFPPLSQIVHRAGSVQPWSGLDWVTWRWRHLEFPSPFPR